MNWSSSWVRSKPLVPTIVLVCTLAPPALLAWSAAAQHAPGSAAAAAISGTGLLPVYGADVTFDAAGGVEAFAKSWTALAPLGFGVARFTIDVREGPAAAERVAALAVWAMEHQVKLVPVLAGAKEGEPIQPTFAAEAGAFVTSLHQTLSAMEPSRAQAYSQLLALQIERAMNDAGRHGGMAREAALLRLIQAAGAIRKAEQPFLAGAGINATPLMIEVSFDAELKAAGFGPGLPFDDAGYASAVAPLASFVKEAAASADVDLIAIEYFPGSVSAGSAGDLTRLVRDVSGTAPGKKIVVGTGFSEASGFPDDRRRAYTLAFANLADHRASEGVDSALLGVMFRWALEEPASDALAGIAGSVTQANASTPPQEQPPPAALETAASSPAEPGGDPGLVAAAKDKVQQFLLGLLDRSLEKMSSGMMGGGGLAAPDAADPASIPQPTGPAAAPQLVISEMTVTPSQPGAGKTAQIDVLVHNKSAVADADGLTAALVGADGSLLNADTMPTDLLISAGDNRMLHLAWTPAASGKQKVAVVIADASLTELAKSPFTSVSISGGAPANDLAPTPHVPLGFPAVTQLKLSPSSQVIVSMRNPYRQGLKAVSVTVAASGRTAITKTMPYMAPGQTRSLTFPGFVPSRSGSQDVHVTMKSGAKSTSFSSRLLLPAVKPVAAPAPPRMPVRTAGVVTRPSPQPDRSQPQPQPQPQSQSQQQPQPRQPPLPLPPQRQPAPSRQPAPDTPARVVRPDLAIVDASYATQATRTGQTLLVKVAVRNVGDGPAEGVQLSCAASGAPRATHTLPGVIAPGQTRVMTCQLQLRGTGSAQLGVAVSAPGDANGSNNQRVFAIQPARRR